MEARTAGTAPYSLQMPEWLVFLLTLCGVAEGVFAGAKQPPEAAVSAQCVAAVLNDPQRRVAILGGREGMPRSLASVYGGSITRFLGGFRGGFSRTITMPDVNCIACNGATVSRDGSALLISDSTYGGAHAIHIFSVHTGAHVQTIGRRGRGPLQFWSPSQVWVASDGFVFVADWYNNRVQVLTPRYDFHSFVGVGQLERPTGVCADDDVVVVSEPARDRISVFNRIDGTLAHHIGQGQLKYPVGLCLMSGHRHVAVADNKNNRVSVWTLNGEFIRHVGVGKLKGPAGVACSNADELVVVDWQNDRFVVFSASGEIVWTSEASAGCRFTGVAMHGSTIFVQASEDGKCVVFA